MTRVYLSPPEQSKASPAHFRELWEAGTKHTFRAVCEDRRSASRKRYKQLTGAFLRLFISQPGCVHWFACGAPWSCSSLQTTRPPERERERQIQRDTHANSRCCRILTTQTSFSHHIQTYLWNETERQLDAHEHNINKALPLSSNVWLAELYYGVRGSHAYVHVNASCSLTPGTNLPIWKLNHNSDL